MATRTNRPRTEDGVAGGGESPALTPDDVKMGLEGQLPEEGQLPDAEIPGEINDGMPGGMDGIDGYGGRDGWYEGRMSGGMDGMPGGMDGIDGSMPGGMDGIRR